MAAAVDVGALLSSGPADLGLTPLLAGLWGDHAAALPHWFAQESQLRAHYSECAKRRAPTSLVMMRTHVLHHRLACI